MDAMQYLTEDFKIQYSPAEVACINESSRTFRGVSGGSLFRFPLARFFGRCVRRLSLDEKPCVLAVHVCVWAGSRGGVARFEAYNL